MLISEDDFKKLATPLCKNKDKSPKRYNEKYYKDFLDYLKEKNINETINEKNFKMFFLEFCDFYFENSRIDFSTTVKQIIAEKSGFFCAMPACREYTKGFDIPPFEKKSGFGQAAHIYSASKGNKTRSPNGIESAFISSEKNGIWLCSKCHLYVDHEPLEDIYTTEIMFAYKKNIEEQIECFLKSINKKYKDLNEKEKKQLEKYINSNKKKEINFNKLSLDEVKSINVINAISKIDIGLNESDFYKALNLEKIKINIDNTFFHNINDSVREIYNEYIVLQPFEIRNFVLNFKGKHRIFTIDDCTLTRSGDKSTIEGFFFDKSSLFHEAFIFMYQFDSDIQQVKMEIKINFKKLFEKDEDIRYLGDFGEVLDLIDDLENNEIQVKINKKKNEKYEIINNYQKLNCNVNNFKDIITFLKLIQYISIELGLNIIVNEDLINKNLISINSINILYDSIVLDNIPEKIIIHNSNVYSKYNYNFENIYIKVINKDKNIIKPVEKFRMNFLLTIFCKNLVVIIEFKNYYYIEKAYSIILTNNINSIVEVNYNYIFF